jgi:hypothetical protein
VAGIEREIITLWNAQPPCSIASIARRAKLDLQATNEAIFRMIRGRQIGRHIFDGGNYLSQIGSNQSVADLNAKKSIAGVVDPEKWAVNVGQRRGDTNPERNRRSCQWPLWGENEEIGAFCQEGAVRGKSYCVAHMTKAYLKKTRGIRGFVMSNIRKAETIGVASAAQVVPQATAGQIVDQGFMLIQRGLNALGAVSAQEVAGVVAQAIVAHAETVV